LRIAPDGCSRLFLWFIIISVNVILGVSGLILWIQCWPVQKLWIYDLEATCWPKHIVENYQTFTSSTWPCSCCRGKMGAARTLAH
jgi:hypothetical protein